MKKITTGTEDFKEFIDADYYYVDKTKLVEVALIDKVSLFTRPRRFGKTLNMSMLYYFFSNKETNNAYLFHHLHINKQPEALKHQNQYPVIFITLKDMKRSTFESQIEKFSSIIAMEISKNKEVLTSSLVDFYIRGKLNLLYEGKGSLSDIMDGLFYLSQGLHQLYGQKVIILIDEYDVPLQTAYQYRYYNEMSNFMSNVLSACLKTNSSLFKGVMTGCLRIAKESIFTGLNNFKVYSIFEEIAQDCFGFTQKEIDNILDYYSLKCYRMQIQEWYDGYLFGNTDIYNPWSTLYYINELLVLPTKEPISYWANTSGNEIVYTYIQNSDETLREEFEKLIQGETIIEQVYPELTYREMDDIHYIYSFLLYTGYLKVKKNLRNWKCELVIPNKEVRMIYENHFNHYFSEYTKDKQTAFVEALRNEEAEAAMDILNDLLEKSVSFYDNYENFYHGFLVGLLSGYRIKSNHEAGNGRFDIAIFPTNILKKCIVIECKKSDHPKNLEKDCMRACQQIEMQDYITGLKRDGYKDVTGYGISFYKKMCYLMKV